MRIVFMGTPEFSVPILSALIEAGHDIPCVFTRAPKPAGRGSALTPSPVHRFAQAAGISVRTPATLKAPEEQDFLRRLEPELAVVAAYGLLLPQAVLDIPARGCWNLHASLLPRWRGAAPIQRAILAGDLETGVCLMRMEAGLDTGPVLARSRLPIGPDDDAETVHDGLSGLAARLIASASAHPDGLSAAPQPEEGATYAAKIDKAETRIDWTKPAVEIERAVRAFAPKPGAWCLLDGERLRILSAKAAAENGSVAAVSDYATAGRPGETVGGPLRIACGTGVLDVLSVQKAGKSPMGTAEFLHGRPVPTGSRFG